MTSSPTLSRISAFLTGALLLASTSVAFADTGETINFSGVGKLTVEQIGPEGSPNTVGTWTLINPDNTTTVSSDTMKEIDSLPAGNYTITEKIPESMSVSIEVSVNGVTAKSLDRPQATFTVNGGQDIRVKIVHVYTRVGSVSVTSSPLGLTFTLKGPNGVFEGGATPQSFEGVPEGQYTVYFDDIPGCVTPKPKSDRLVKDGRISLSISVSCDALPDTDQGKDEQKSADYVTVTVNGKAMTFVDAKSTEWFAKYVANVVKTGIMSGYNDAAGNPLGTFGPGDQVTIAQLAKIAHKIADIDEAKILVPAKNKKAAGQWYERFVASAEQSWWEVYRDGRVDPNRPATRGEVIATLLRALDVPKVWAHGKTFGDVLPTTPYADAIETAAADKLIDATTGNFRPNDPINRAEMAKLVTLAAEIYVSTNAEFQGKPLK